MAKTVNRKADSQVCDQSDEGEIVGHIVLAISPATHSTANPAIITHVMDAMILSAYAEVLF